MGGRITNTLTDGADDVCLADGRGIAVDVEPREVLEGGAGILGALLAGLAHNSGDGVRCRHGLAARDEHKVRSGEFFHVVLLDGRERAGAETRSGGKRREERREGSKVEREVRKEREEGPHPTPRRCCARWCNLGEVRNLLGSGTKHAQRRTRGAK